MIRLDDPPPASPSSIQAPAATRRAARNSQRMEVGKVTTRGRCLTVPLGLVGVVTMWIIAVGLLAWRTFGGESAETTGQWGLLASAAAASWTVLYGLAHHHEMLREAFELGRMTGEDRSGPRSLSRRD